MMSPSKAWPQVWLVDDSEVDLMLATRVLERSGLVGTVRCHEGAREALQAWQMGLTHGAELPSLILLDINMPGMGGFELLQALESLPPSAGVSGDEPANLPVPPVVMLSSSPDPADRRRALAHACVRDFLVKPLTGQHLAELAQRW